MKTPFVFGLAALCVALTPGGSDLLAAEEESAADSASRIVAKTLDVVWTNRPEGVDMFADILIKGGNISGGDGWFRRSPSRTRFDWRSVRERFDRDADGTISRGEFAGSDEDFTCLDRDGDGTLNEVDFDFSPKPAPPTPGAILFSRADADANGKLTEEELLAFFRKADGGGQGYLSMDDVRKALSPASGPGRASEVMSRGKLLKSLARRELGAFSSGPSLNETAPGFTLRRVDNGEEVTLAQVVGAKPIVLVFGDFTCGPFRAQAGNIAKLHKKYKARATFLMVYVREPHPLDGWRMERNDHAGIAVRQPRDFDERVNVAKACNAKLDLGFPMLVDTMDDAVNNAYSGVPSRLYLIDRSGKIAFKNGRGPFGFNLDELEHSLVLLLQQDGSGPSAAGPATR